MFLVRAVTCVKSDTASQDAVLGEKPVTLPSGETIWCGFDASTSTDLFTVPVSNRFSLLSQLDASSATEEFRAATTRVITIVSGS